VGDLVFGWRLAMRLQLLEAEIRLQTGAPEPALTAAVALGSAARERGVPRYDACARLLADRARAALGEPVDPSELRAAVAAVEQAVGIEAWRWAGRAAAEVGDEGLLARSEELVAGLATASGPHGDALRAHAARQLDDWRAVTRR
jgi:hypothetical protein